MKKLLTVLLIITQCINIFAIDVKTQNHATRINEGSVKYIWKPQMAKKPTNYSYLLGDPGYIAELGLDCYLIGDTKQFAISVKFQYVYLEFPGVLPMGSCLTIKTKDNQIITLNSILAQSETKYVLLPIGHDETSTWGYFPISEDDINKLSSGVDLINFDYVYFDGVNIVAKKANLAGNDFSKKITNYYRKISKKESKSKDRIASMTTSIQKFLSYDQAAVILLYHGYSYNDFLYQKYLDYSGDNASSEAYKEFQGQKDEVQSIYNSELLNSVAESVEKQSAAYNKQMNAAVSNMHNQFQQLSANLQQERAQKAAMEKAKQEQQRAELESRMRANTLANQQRMEAKEQMERDRANTAAQNYHNSYEQARSNGSTNRSMETSDLAQHNAAIMSDATYGTAVTNQALAQQRQYDAQQNQQVLTQQRQINQQQAQQAQSQQLLSGSVVNAVTSAGSHIQLKINGNNVVAYSISNSTIGGV